MSDSSGSTSTAARPKSNQFSDKRPLKERSTTVRIIIAAVLILTWFVGAGIGGPYFGRVSEVANNEQSSYLPESSDATRVQQIQAEFADSKNVPAIILVESDEPLTEAQIGAVQSAVQSLSDIEGVNEGASPPIPSEDGKAVQVFLPVDGASEIGGVVESIRADLDSTIPDGLTSYVTGPAGFSGDLLEAFGGVDGLLLLVAVVAVFLILIFVYRSILLPITVLATSMFALCVALLVVWWMAKWDILLLSGQTQGILFILVIGATTDYSLLYVARYREELRKEKDKWKATQRAVRQSFEPILASGSTVIVGLLCLLLSDLKSNSALGPVASVGIIFAMAAALTFLPAMLYVQGRTAYWPRRPKYEPDAVAEEDGMPRGGVWRRVGELIKKRPRPVWIAVTVALVIGAAFTTQLKVDGVPTSELILSESEARDGQEALAKHFPGGTGSPVTVVVDEESLMDAGTLLAEHENIASVSVLADGTVSGTATLTPDGLVAPPGPPSDSEPTPKVENGRVILQGTLSVAPDTAEAQQTVRDIRAEYEGESYDALVGGVTATNVDTIDTSTHDRTLIIPIVLIVITLILMLVLRSVVAPILLIATTVLSFLTAMGVSALVFNHILNFPGADPAVPLYGFVFLVALGIDYNIFLMTRAREESLEFGARRGVLRSLAITGSVITTAGIVLAATFAALAVIPILFLAQLAFIVAFGVLLDTFVVRTLLVPALVYDIGPKSWWPSVISKKEVPDGEEVAANA